QIEQRKRREEIVASVDPKAPSPAPQWYVNSRGQTMVVLASYEPFLMGSGTSEVGRSSEETQHWVRIGCTFALAAKSVTLGQFLEFDNDYEDSLKKLDQKYYRSHDLPAVVVDWFRGAKYCNWLSEKEGLAEKDWCYEIEGKSIKLKANYLSLSGYRLPSEAEME